MSTLNELAQRCHATAKSKGWYDKNGGERNDGEMLMLMVSELAEALEELRNGNNPNYIYYSPLGDIDKPYPSGADPTVLKPEGVPIELADLLIRLLDYCALRRIDIDYAIRLKMTYNMTRPYRHGNKLA